MAPEVSVIMAAYNAEAFLAESVESILGQTFEDFEFIVIDDHSTDGTARMLSEYAGRENRLAVHRNDENMGLTRSLNRGLDLAGGRFVARHDADDVAVPERLALQAAYLTAHPEAAVVGGSVRLIDGQGHGEEVFVEPTDPLVIRWRLLFSNPVAHTTAFWRRETVERLAGRYDESFTCSQDYDLWSRLAEKAEIHNLPQVLSAQRRHEDCVSYRHGDRQLAYTAQVSDPQLRRLLPGEEPSAQDLADVRALTSSPLSLLTEERLQLAALRYLKVWRLFRQEQGTTDREREQALRLDIEADLTKILIHCLKRGALGPGRAIVRDYLGDHPDRTGFLCRLGLKAAGEGLASLARRLGAGA